MNARIFITVFLCLLFTSIQATEHPVFSDKGLSAEVLKSVKKEAKRHAKKLVREGWKSTTNLSIEQQLYNYYVFRITDIENYYVQEIEVTHNSLEKANSIADLQLQSSISSQKSSVISATYSAIDNLIIKNDKTIDKSSFVINSKMNAVTSDSNKVKVNHDEVFSILLYKEGKYTLSKVYISKIKK